MKIFDTIHSKQILPKLFSNDRRILGVSAFPPVDQEGFAKRKSPLSIYCSVFSDDGKDLLGLFTMAITNQHYYQKLLQNQVNDENFELWNGEDTPILFLRHLIINDRRSVPFLLRYSIKDLQKVCQKEQIYLHRAFTIVPHWTGRSLLVKYQFEESGRYCNRYPIMLASREDSIFLNSYLKEYGV